MQPSLQLILPKEYLQDAVTRISNATYRIALTTMTLVEGEATDELVEALCNAARRGVEVHVAADTYTYTEFKGSYIPTNYRSRRVREAIGTQKKLKEAGVQFHWLGRLSIVAFAGRTHLKWCIVDDYVYSFGGVNIDKNASKNLDFMFGTKNESLADRLFAEQMRIIRADRSGHAYRSHSFGDDDNMVLIDGGFFGDSLIYRRACHWAELSHSILLVSQYCPTGKLGRLISKTDSQLYFNHYTNATFTNRLMIRIGMFFSRQSTRYKKRAYLHAKFMIFTLKDGKKVAITGSHNFTRAGVFAGTREVALETKNKKVIAQLERFFKDYVK